MLGKRLYACKAECKKLGTLCHDTKNRIITMMSCVEESSCKKLGTFLKCCITCECLCWYICCCCCEMEKLENSCLQELQSKCKQVTHCCDILNDCLSKGNYLKINCEKIKSACHACEKNSECKASRKPRRRSRRK